MFPLIFDFSYIMNMKGMPHIAGNWNLTLELRSDSYLIAEKGVFLKGIRLARIPITKSNEELKLDETKFFTVDSTPSTFTTTYSTTSDKSTSSCETTNGLILGNRTTELVMIILVVIFILSSIILTLKYCQVRDKCRELEDIFASDHTSLPEGRNEALVR